MGSKILKIALVSVFSTLTISLFSISLYLIVTGNIQPHEIAYEDSMNTDPDLASAPTILSTTTLISNSRSLESYRNFNYDDYYLFIKVSNKKLSDKTIDVIIRSVEKYGRRYGVSEDEKAIFYSIGRKETHYKNSDSYKGAQYGRGYFQVSEQGLSDFNNKYGWKVNEWYQPEDLYDPEINVEVGLYVFKQNYIYAGLNRYDHKGAIISYNVGANRYLANKKSLDNNIYQNARYDYYEDVKKYFYQMGYRN